jgi:hypothetical protein
LPAGQQPADSQQTSRGPAEGSVLQHRPAAGQQTLVTPQQTPSMQHVSGNVQQTLPQGC